MCFLWMNLKQVMKAIAENFTEKFISGYKDFWFFFSSLFLIQQNNDFRNHRHHVFWKRNNSFMEEWFQDCSRCYLALFFC